MLVCYLKGRNDVFELMGFQVLDTNVKVLESIHPWYFILVKIKDSTGPKYIYIYIYIWPWEGHRQNLSRLISTLVKIHHHLPN